MTGFSIPQTSLAPQAPAQSSSIGNAIWNVGAIAQVGGSIIAQIGAYAGAVAAKDQLKTGAMTEDHRAVMDELGATQATIAAQSVRAEGRKARGRYAMRAAQEQSSARTSAAARGVSGNSGSAAEIQASLKYAQQVDELTIDSNTMRQAQELERRAVSLRSSADFRRVSAENMRSTAGAISPGLAVATQAMQGAAQSANNFAARFK
jgi:hypothetical protein